MTTAVLELGTLEEAQAIYDAYAENHRAPEGWTMLGSGGTRTAFLSPSGVCYKVCHHYYGMEDGEEPTENDIEHSNFKKIAESGKLPPNWRVPRSHLHAFQANQQRWEWRSSKKVDFPVRVAVLACEYVEGKAVGWDANAEESDEIHRGFRSVGLSDTGGHNSVKCPDGTWYLIDAGEDFVSI